jgi:hypothetical protein
LSRCALVNSAWVCAVVLNDCGMACRPSSTTSSSTLHCKLPF